MDVFRKLPHLTNDKLHPKFKILRDEPYYYGARKIIESWTHDFHDRDNDITKKFQTTFHSSFWEFYLHALLKELNFTVNLKYNRPDYIITDPLELYIEAVVSEIKAGGRSESERTEDDHFSMLIPISTKSEFSELIDEAIARHSNSIRSKLEKYTGYVKKGKIYKGYIDCDWVSRDKPYVIALSSYDQINYGKEYIYSMMALFYGFYYCPESKNYYPRKSIQKPNTTSDIKISLFDDEFRDISAIFFCNTLTLGKLSSLNKSKGTDPAYIINVRYDFEPPHFKVHEVSSDNPEHLFDGLYVFHNPNAKNKLSKEALDKSGIFQFSIDENGVFMEGFRRPIVVRYCDPMGHIYKELIKSTAASNYNETIAWEILEG